MGRKDPRIDAYIDKAQPFAQPILKRIRKAVHAGCPEIVEDLKWGAPAFTYDGRILAMMAAFKEHCRFGFWYDASAIGKTTDASGNMARFTSADDLPGERQLVAQVKHAVDVHDAGVTPPRRAPRSKPPLEVPPYFTAALKKNKKAFATFEGFSPSHRREYVEWITEAKGEATRQRRLDTAIQWIAEGKPRNWKYITRT